MKAIFIDIDNTLLDFDAYVRTTMERGFAHFGLPAYHPEMYHTFTAENNKLWRQIEEGTLTFAELQKIRWNNVFAALGIHFDGPAFEHYFRAALHESAIPVPGAMELLQSLSGRALLCVASNGPYEQQLHRLEIGGMKPYFDYFFISEHAGAAKPAPAFFDYAFRELNENRSVPILPQETLIIGDSLSSDIAGGLQYGMKTCYYRRPGAPAAPPGWTTPSPPFRRSPPCSVWTDPPFSQAHHPAPQGGAPRRDGLRPSPWLRHGPCGASLKPRHLRKFTPKKSDPRFSAGRIFLLSRFGGASALTPPRWSSGSFQTFRIVYRRQPQ